jgi:hypothetical protein
MMVVGMLLSLGALSMTALASTAAHAEITRSGDTVYVQGQIEKDDHLRFTDLVDDGVTTVVLNSSGGYVHVAIAIGTLVHERQLTTVVAPGGMCGSACVAAWAGGTPRRLAPGARLAIHCSRPEGASECSEAGNNQMARHLQDMGMPPSVVQMQAAAGMNYALVPSDTAGLVMREQNQQLADTAHGSHLPRARDPFCGPAKLVVGLLSLGMATALCN